MRQVGEASRWTRLLERVRMRVRVVTRGTRAGWASTHGTRRHNRGRAVNGTLESVLRMRKVIGWRGGNKGTDWRGEAGAGASDSPFADAHEKFPPGLLELVRSRRLQRIG